jgi:Fe-S oxidoreductase
MSKGAPDSFNLSAPAFWDEAELYKEWHRIADICNSCRLCFNLCPAFPALLDRIDELDGDPDRLSPADFTRVVNLCYGCKLCYVKCPYTPPHQYQLDFPRQVIRSRAVRARLHGITLQDRFLGMTDVIGRLGILTAPLFNWANRFPPQRWLMEKILGLDHSWRLPVYYRQTFAQWFRSRPRASGVAADRKVALFYTCTVNYSDPETGKAAVAVLEHNGVEVVCPEQRCCGMPAMDGGDMEATVKAARFNVNSFLPYVRQGYDIVIPGPTCTFAFKQEYPLLLPSPETDEVAAHTFDLCEYLWLMHRQHLLKTDFVRNPGKVVYQVPCLLKAQNIGNPSYALLQLIPGLELEMVDRCSGIDGTWGMKKQYRQLSLQVAGRLLSAVQDAQPAVAVSDCPLAGMQIEQGTGVTAIHPVSILKQAYGL